VHRFAFDKTSGPANVGSPAQGNRESLSSLTGERWNQSPAFHLNTGSAIGASAMRKSTWTNSIVPYGADQTVYVVVDASGRCGKSFAESEVEHASLETVLSDLLSGRFHDPIRVVAFNTLEHWSTDVSSSVAREIQSRCDSDGSDVPQYLAGFMEIHIGTSLINSRFRA
jgi:hypothetical protein